MGLAWVVIILFVGAFLAMVIGRMIAEYIVRLLGGSK
jgi:hypothetical protein